MGEISLADVRIGMTLHADVVAREGRLLLTAGTALTESHLRVLSMWDVAEVDVEGLARADLASAALAGLTPRAREAVDRRLRALFRHSDPTDPVIEALVHLATMRLIRQAPAGAHGS